MPRLRPAAVLLALCALAAGLPAVEIMSPDQVQVGMKGIGRSVFRGYAVEEFQVEVLGVMKRSYSGHDMILARCSGANLEHTGVIAGMSGSPVFIDGKLLGAVSMTYGFAKDPIAEITPIQPMLEVMNRPDHAEDGGLLPGGPDRVATSGLQPIPCPLAVSGLDDRLCAAFAPRFERFGLRLTTGSTEVGGAETLAAKLEPGSAVGVALVRGDANASAIGTLTWRDGDKLVAFGHPMFLGGAVEMPMVGGIIHSIMPSLALSFKMFSPTAPIGAITQDRSVGVGGRIGPRVRMIPVRVRVQGDDAVTDFSYELLNHRNLTPDLLSMVIANALTSRHQARFDATAQAGFRIKLRGYPEIRYRRWFAGEQVFGASAYEAAGALQFLMNNEFERVTVESIAVDLVLSPGVQWQKIGRLIADRVRCRAGDTLELTAVLESHRGPGADRTFRVIVPRETPEGVLTISAMNPDSAFRLALLGSGPAMAPRSVGQMIRLIEQLGNEDEIVIQGQVRKKGSVMNGARYPNLPPSMLTLLAGSSGYDGPHGVTDQSLILEQRFKTGRMVVGGQTVRVVVEK